MKRNLQILKLGGQAIGISIASGAAIAVVITVLMNIGLTSLVINGQIAESDTAFIVFIIRAVSVMIGGMIASALAKEKILITIGITAIGYLLIVVALGIIFYDGSFRNFISGVISVAVGAVCACVLRLKTPRKKKHSVKYLK